MGTYPMEAGQIRKGGHIMIKGNPCKVLDVSTSKTGKHGHAKCHFVAQDIFSGKKMEDLVPASHTTNVPFVKKVELQCMGVDDDGFVSLLTDDGGMREDIKLPNTLNQAPPDAEEVSKRITDFLEKETEFNCIILCACSKEVITDTKVVVPAPKPNQTPYRSSEGIGLPQGLRPFAECAYVRSGLAPRRPVGAGCFF